MFHHTDGDVTEARHYFREALHDVNDVYWEKVKVAMNMLKVRSYNTVTCLWNQ